MTKRKAGNKKGVVDPNLKFREMVFSVNSLAGCCGIGVVSSFSEQSQSSYDWSDYRGRQVENPCKFSTKREQAEDLYKRILDNTWGDHYGEGEYSCLLISLVSCYAAEEHEDNQWFEEEGKHKKGSHQYPELEKILLREGWQINQVFVNPNHGNEVTLYSKYFPDRTKLQND